METNYDSDYQIRLATLGALGGDVTKEYDSVYEIDQEILRLTSQGGGTSYTAGTGIDITEDTISVDSSLLTTINGKAEKVDFIIPVDMATSSYDWSGLNSITETGIYKGVARVDYMGMSLDMAAIQLSVINAMSLIIQTTAIFTFLNGVNNITMASRQSSDNGSTWSAMSESGLPSLNDDASVSSAVALKTTYSRSKIDSLISSLDQRLTAIGG